MRTLILTLFRSKKKIIRYDIQLNTTKHQNLSETNLLQALDSEAVTYVPGGCSYNTIRIMNVK